MKRAIRGTYKEKKITRIRFEIPAVTILLQKTALLL